ncbi:MAG: hypothetical protein CVU77_05820 [Elusimicrobia bacterium HGW-Elusimicrobia-1]|jgi:hypothetical protein|nr:MAG: hypothetical protein CVU77_05820 [Elusimicrobia bacterium HGW-Elusimicrobia-1]
MKKLIVGLLVVSFAGCSMKSPMFHSTMTSIQVPADKYEILSSEEVRGRATNSILFGLLFFGDAGLAAAYKDALSKNPSANTLVNTMVDGQHSNILGIYQSYTTIVTGLPARIKK